MALSPAEKQRRYRERLKARAAGEMPAAPILANVPPVKRWQAMQAQASEIIARLRDEMQAYFDERSDTWRESDRADAMQERLDALEEAQGALDGIEF